VATAKGTASANKNFEAKRKALMKRSVTNAMERVKKGAERQRFVYGRFRANVNTT